MNQPFSTRLIGGTAVVALDGEIDVSNSPRVRRELLARLARHARVVVDLGAVRHLDTSAVAGLVEAYHAARDAGRTFSLAAVGGAALRVLKLVRLDQILVIHPNVEAALKTG